MLTIVLLAIVIALLFDFLNGMNDAANSIATIVATRVFSPTMAVCWELCRYLYFWGERGSHDGRRNRGSLENQ